MKTLLIIIIFFASCAKQELPCNSIAIITLDDVTDTVVLRPQARPILDLMDIANNKDCSFYFRYRTLADKVFTQSWDISLPNESVTTKQNTEDIPQHRVRVLIRFRDSIKTIINTQLNQPKESMLKYTQCFRTIANELNILKARPERNKVLLVFSNGAENSDLFNSYRLPIIESSQTVTSEAIKAFESTNLLQDNYRGITLIWVFKPTTILEDRRFVLMMDAYKTLFERRGIVLKIQAQNQSFSLN